MRVLPMQSRWPLNTRGKTHTHSNSNSSRCLVSALLFSVSVCKCRTTCERTRRILPISEQQPSATLTLKNTYKMTQLDRNRSFLGSAIEVNLGAERGVHPIRLHLSSCIQPPPRVKSNAIIIIRAANIFPLFIRSKDVR